MELRTSQTRRKRLAVPPGQSITPDAIENQTQTSDFKPNATHKRGRPKKSKTDSKSSSSDDESDNFSLASLENSPMSFDSSDHEKLQEAVASYSNISDIFDEKQESAPKKHITVEDFVIVVYNGV